MVGIEEIETQILSSKTYDAIEEIQINAECRRSQNRVTLRASHRVGVHKVDFIQLQKVGERQDLSLILSLRKGDPSECRTLMELDSREEGGAQGPPEGQVAS